MFATSNILLHIDNHKSNPFDLFTPYVRMHDNNADRSLLESELVLNTMDVNSEYLEKMFIHNCSKGHLKNAKWCVARGVDIHSRNEWALQICCMEGRIDIAKWLVGLGAKIYGIYGENYLISCCMGGHIDMVEWVVSLGVNYRSEGYEIAFYESCKRGHLDIAKRLWLFSSGVNIHACRDRTFEETFEETCRKGRLDVAKWLYSLSATLSQHREAGGINIHDYNWVFEKSCKHGRLDFAKWLFSLGVGRDHDTIFFGALIDSCKNGHLDVAKWLIEIDCVTREMIEYCEVKYNLNLTEKNEALINVNKS